MAIMHYFSNSRTAREFCGLEAFEPVGYMLSADVICFWAPLIKYWGSYHIAHAMPQLQNIGTYYS